MFSLTDAVNPGNKYIGVKAYSGIFINRVTIRLFFFFCFFPYLAPLPLPTDLQPYAFVASALILLGALVAGRGLPRLVWLLAVPPVAAISLVLLDNASLFAMRASLTYVSLFTVTAVTCIAWQSLKYRLMLRQFVPLATYTWFIAGLIEIFEPRFFSVIISNLSIDADRGVTGLATEPSFYGIYCFMLMGLNYLANNNNKKIFFFLVFQIVFFAQSSITLVFLLIFIIYWVLFYLSLRTIVAAAVAMSFLAVVFDYLLSQMHDSRVSYLVLRVLEDPWSLILIDTSINARIGHVLFSILGFFDNYGVPRGFDHFSEYVMTKINYVDFLWLGSLDSGLKIMSGYGGAFFELGVFGVVIFLVVSIAIVQHFRRQLRRQLLFLFLINTVMFAAIQLSLPFIGMMLGILIASSHRPKRIWPDSSTSVKKEQPCYA